MTEKYERIAVLGVGLIGGAVAAAARNAGLAGRVVGYCRRAEAAKAAEKSKLVEECYTDPVKAASGADFLVLATGPESIPSLAGEVAEALAEGAVATDVASVKSRIVAGCTEALGRKARFVGSHPLAGSERSGSEHSAGVNLDGALCVLTPTGSTDPEALEAVREFWTALGMKTAELSPEEHDTRLARTSHLPHMVAAALASATRKGDEPFCATGLADATRVASGHAGMWTEIAAANRQALAAELYKLTKRLQDVADVLTTGDLDGLRKFLEAGRSQRSEIFGDD